AFAAMYELAKDYSGEDFFDGWDFFDGVDDVTGGDQIYSDAFLSAYKLLAFVESDTKHAFLRVDNYTNVPRSTPRRSVRVVTKASYHMDSVWIADIFHTPYGCGVQPALWSWAPPEVGGNYPKGGGIKTFEAVNQDIFSHMSLYTSANCNALNPNPDQNAASVVNTTNCDNPILGCTTTNTGLNSYGPSFNNGHGGVFITEYSSSGISIWFFPRNNIPISVSSNSSNIDTTDFGIPIANWSPSICGSDGFSEVLLPQSFVIDIALCGREWLGTLLYNQTCPPGNCFVNSVSGDGSNFDEAYFEIGAIRVF
ncbi:hypothetical protein BDQ17DRAFT_1185278, partial [Cyathus striatus]